MQLSCSIASLFLSQSFMWCNNSTNFALKLCIPSSGDDNTDSATRSQCIQSLVAHGITDKAAQLCTYAKLQSNTCYVLPYRWFLDANDHTWKYNTQITSRHDAIHLQTGFKLPLEVDWLNAHSIWISVNAHSVWTQTMQINLLPMRITFMVWACLKVWFITHFSILGGIWESGGILCPNSSEINTVWCSA